MKLLFTLILTSSSFAVCGQQPVASPTPEGEIRTSVSGPGITGLPVLHRPILIKLGPNQNGYVRPDAATRRKRFINSTVGPFALGKNIATAGIGTWRNSPEEWGPTWEGYGRRVASNLGKNAIKQTMKFGLEEAFKLDSHFYRSKSKSIGARMRNALISPVTARNKDGKRVFGFPSVAGTYGSSIVAYEAWYPNRYDWKDGVRSGTISLGFNAAFNVFKEFFWKK